MDVLPLGTRSDLLWSMGPYNPDFYKFSISRTPEQIKTAVFESRRVQYIIEKVRKLYQYMSVVTQYETWVTILQCTQSSPMIFKKIVIMYMIIVKLLLILLVILDAFLNK